MAKILFGGPDEKDYSKFINDHDDLISLLRAQNHEVNYTNDAIYFGFLLTSFDYPHKKKPDLILYDTRLFYPCRGIQDSTERVKKRTSLFESETLRYLKSAKTNVIILADSEITSGIEDIVKNAEMIQVNIPYNSEKLAKKIKFFLKLSKKP
jgi:hypothetical protein